MNQTREHSLIQGNILKSLISFAFPVLLALFLQAMYGAADLIIVGQFADTFEQSGVASGSQLFNMITMVITGLSMGVTVFVGDCIGAGKPEKAGKGIGTGIAIFAVLAWLPLSWFPSVIHWPALCTHPQRPFHRPAVMCGFVGSALFSSSRIM